MRTGINREFDKLLLGCFLLVFMALAIVYLRHPGDERVFDWISRAFDMFAGALLTLITSKGRPPDLPGKPAIAAESTTQAEERSTNAH